MVVMRLPAADDIGVTQLQPAPTLPWTVHAPHSPIPQPNFVPVSSAPSRKYHNSGISGSPSYWVVFPLIVSWIIGAPSLIVSGGRRAGPPTWGALVLDSTNRRQVRRGKMCWELDLGLRTLADRRHLDGKVPVEDLLEHREHFLVKQAVVRQKMLRGRHA